MANNDWYASLESKIFTIMKTRIVRNLRSKYPDIFCTSSGRTDSDPVFPTVYIHELPGMEQGMDIENSGINAVLETIQVDVTTNQSMKDCTHVMTEVITQLKLLHFNVSALPTYLVENENIYRGIVRARRLIGSDDTLT